MCGICNKIGIRHEDLNLQESSPALPIYKDAASSSGTLNFNEGDNIIIPSENGVTYRGLSGDDAYIISTNTTEPNSKIEIVDSVGDNIIQFINGLVISKSLFTSDAMRLTLSDGSVITINGADKFTFELSGNLTDGSSGDKKTFSEFAKYMGLESLPSSGSDEGNKNVTIKSNLDNEESQEEIKEDTSVTSESRKIIADLSKLTIKSGDTIKAGESITIDLDKFYTVGPGLPKEPTKLEEYNNLSEVDIIIFYKTQNNTLLSVKDSEKGIEILDLSFLEFDEGTLEFYQSYWAYDNNLTPRWYSEEYSSGIWDIFNIEGNSLVLSPKSYFDKSDDELEFELTPKNDDGTLDDPYISRLPIRSGTDDAFKIKVKYEKDGIEKIHIIELDSIFSDSDDKSKYQNKINSLEFTSIEYEIQDNSHPYFTRDQILLDSSKLKIIGGVDNAEVFPVYLKIRASVINADGYEYDNPEDGYFDIELTLMMTDDDYVRTQSSKIIENKDNETSISIEEDNPGDILLDLSNFNIDPGTAKIKTVKINHLKDYDPFEPYISETFYIDEKVLKFTEGTLYDYDGDQLSWINHIKNDEENDYGYAYIGDNYKTFGVRDNDFEITFTYKSNNEEFEHVLKIVEYENTTYGSAFSSDYFLRYSNEKTDNKYINALKFHTRLPHLKAEKESYLMEESEWNNYETTITYAFLDPVKDQYHNLGEMKDTIYFEPYLSADTAHPYNDNAKNMMRSILDTTSDIFKITFEEVDYKMAQIRFSLYTSTSEDGSTNYAGLPSSKPRNNVLVGDENSFKESNFVTINPGGSTYNVAIHELGHNLGMLHPFDGYPDIPGYAESYYANSLFTVMAYATFWSKEVDIYETGLPQKYTSYAKSISGISKDTPNGLQDDYGIALLGWGRDDILTLGHIYGLRDNYNAGDNIYSWDENKNIYETIHDMGGNDTIDLSNYAWDMNIDLNPGSVSEVGIGQERIHWNSKKGEKTGDVFILSWETTIENYIGSTGSNTVTLNNKISNNIDLSISEDKNIIYNAITSDIIFGSGYEDYFYVTISNLEEINDSINIDGGADFDWLVIEAPVKLNSLENINTIEISKNNDKALVALKENIKGMEILDLNFLNIDEGSLEISEYYYNAYYRIIEDPPIDGYDYYWWDKDNKYSYFALKDNILSLYGDNSIKETGIPDIDAEYTEAQLITPNQGWLPIENFKVKLSYTSGGIEKEYTVEIDSIYNSETPYSEYFEPEEDLDLDFNLTDLLTHFDNIENFDFTNNEKNIITVTEDTFQLSNKTKIKGDENDEIILPDSALQTSSDNLYLYYSLNEVEIGISVDLILI
ncbi:hypothetical protein OAI78_01715 [Rhodobiaceae bacterium]|nr:hypothetical protein [Rhodobiaceae bacterium]